MLDSSATAQRLSAAYATYYGTVGLEYVYMPFFFTRIGLTPGEVGLVYAGRIGTMILFQPLTTELADRTGRPYLVLKCSMALGFLCAAGLILAHNFWPAALFMWVQAAFRSVAIPILDATTLRERGPERYGRTRLWGSVGYGVGALGFAAAVAKLTYDQTGAIVLPAYLTMNALMVASLFFLPADLRTTAKVEHGARLVTPAIASLMALGAVHWAAVETYNTYFSLTAKERGFSPSVPGYGVAIGIICEMSTFFMLAWFLKRAPATVWIIVSIVVSILRWLITAYAPNEAIIVLAQSLHAFSFALWWGAMLKVLGEVAPPARRGALQGLFTAAIMGVGGTIGSSISGRVLGLYGSTTMYLVAAVLEVVALAIAVITIRHWHLSTQASLPR